MHGHDAHEIIPGAHGGMIVAVAEPGFPGFPQIRNKVGQAHVSGLLPVHGPLIQRVQIGLPGLSVRIGAPGRVNAGFPHEPPDEIRHRHAFADFSPGCQLIGHHSALPVDGLFIPPGAQLKGFIEGHMLQLFQPDIRQIAFREAEGRVDQGARQGVIVMQIINDRQQTQKGLDFRQTEEVRNPLVHGGDMHLFQMIHNGACAAFSRPEQDDDIPVLIMLLFAGFRGGGDQGLDIPAGRLALSFQLIGGSCRQLLRFLAVFRVILLLFRFR